MISFTEIKDEENNVIGVIKNDDGKVWSVPTDKGNSDYQAYLKSINN
jgi:hypothetical protein